MPFDMLPQEPAEPQTVKNLRMLRAVIQTSPLVDLNEWLCCLGGHAERIFGLHSAHKLKAALGVTNVFFAGSSRTAFYKTGFCHREAHRQEALGRIDDAIKRQLKKAAKEAHEQLLLQLVA